MEEFSKALTIVHRTLLLATIAVFAFALSDDPMREFKDALAAASLLQTIDPERLVLDRSKVYKASGLLSALTQPPGASLWPAAGFDDALLRCSTKPEVVHGNETAVQPGVQA